MLPLSGAKDLRVRAMSHSQNFEEPRGPLEISEQEAHILLLGDCPSVRDLQCRVSLAGYAHITRVPDLAATERALLHGAPHLLIADPAVTPAQGPESFIRTLHRLLPASAAPSIVCLVPHAEQARDFLEAGAHDVWTLPAGSWIDDRLRMNARIGLLQHRTLTQHRDFSARIQARTARLERAMSVLKQAEMHLVTELESSKAASRKKSEFIAHISHELRNPLNAISGFAEIMKEEMFGPLGHERYRSQARTIHTASQHLLGIVNGLLDLAKAEAGKLEIKPETVEVRALVQETVELLSQQAASAGVTLKVDIAQAVLEIESDAGKMRQILINLVSNAIKFTPAGGRVIVSARPDEKSGVLILVVSDTGIGIAPQDLEGIMQPYVQVPRRSAKAIGTGLGLPITKHFVDLLGGTIDVTSEVGKGTVFTVRLPRRPPDAAGNEAEEQQEDPHPACEPMRPQRPSYWNEPTSPPAHPLPSERKHSSTSR